MKLNLGCGEWYADGWVNIDLGSPHRKDIEADIRQPLPLDGLATHAYLGHVLEHFTLDDAAGVLLNVRKHLAPGAKVMVVGPDVDRGQAMLDSGAIDQAQLDTLKLGEGRWPGDAHLWECRPAALVSLLTQSGLWSQVTEIPILRVPEEWPVVSRIGWQCAVSAVA